MTAVTTDLVVIEEVTDDITALVRATLASELRPTPPAGTQVALAGSIWCPTTKVTVGIIDAAARQAFTQGQCHALALALVEATGWKLCWTGSSECAYDEDCCDYPEEWGWCPCQVGHLLVETGNGVYVDIDGQHTAAEIAAGEEVVVPITAEQLSFVLLDPCWREPDIHVARGFVSAVLAQLPSR